MPADPTPAAAQPQLSVRLDATWMHGILRADKIRHDTLVSLATAWADDEGRDLIVAALDALAAAMQSPREGELDSLVEAVEDAAGMDDAEIRIDLHDALRLRNDLDAVIEKLARFNPAVAARPVLLAKMPAQRKPGAAA
ncbi:hypothetical protein ACFWTC_02975 [Streptomyces sp. NPDC058619]|uniref:hypothetical protein n=1 Tax=unclassified Streptomyces TaxID=2593676 RepID=UPI00364B89F1